jgi:hypothetical protein
LPPCRWALQIKKKVICAREPFAARVSSDSFADFLPKIVLADFYDWDSCRIFLQWHCVFCEDILAYVNITNLPSWTHHVLFTFMCFAIGISQIVNIHS